MKTKLLRKIRKQYSIVYYPNRNGGEYELIYPGKGDLSTDYYSLYNFADNHKDFNKALSHLRWAMRQRYYKYTRKHKISLVKEKVWHV